MLGAEVKVWTQVAAGPAQGIWLELNPRTGQSYMQGEAEMAVQSILVERLQPGIIFYDLGADRTLRCWRRDLWVRTESLQL